MTWLTQECINMQKNSPPVPKNLRHVCPTTCAVCGRKANGYHYEAPSCTGCKTFFRRIVVSQANLSCPNEGSCVTDHEEGTFCRFCRFEKCLAVGMNPHGIRTVDGKDTNVLIKSIISRRSSEGSTEKTPERSVLAAETEKLVDRLLLFEELLVKERVKGDFKYGSIKEFIQKKNMPQSAYCDVHDISSAVWELIAPFGGPCNLGDILSNLVYANLFSFFEKLDEADRIVLIKHGAILCFNFVQAYDQYSRQGSDEEAMEMDSPISPLVEKLQSQIVEPMCRLETTQKEFVLLKALLLCNSSLPNLSDEGWTLIQEEREKISSALFNHCLFEFDSNGPARFAANLSLINSLQAITNLQKDILLLSRSELTGQRILYELIEH